MIVPVYAVWQQFADIMWTHDRFIIDNQDTAGAHACIRHQPSSVS